MWDPTKPAPPVTMPFTSPPPITAGGSAAGPRAHHPGDAQRRHRGHRPDPGRGADVPAREQRREAVAPQPSERLPQDAQVLPDVVVADVGQVLDGLVVKR